MLILLLGLVLFLGVHSTRIFADDWRTAMIARLGPLPWKGLYAAASILGFIVIVWGFRIARQDTLVLYSTPRWMTHVTALLMVISMILFVAAVASVIAAAPAHAQDTPTDHRGVITAQLERAVELYVLLARRAVGGRG